MIESHRQPFFRATAKIRRNGSRVPYSFCGYASARRAPYSASNWSLAQLDAPPEVLARIEHHYYDAGHMMYTREADLVKLKADLVAWLAK